ncbi:MAG: GGDEF domain-containing protein [Acidimicrobiales bacterium]
MSRELDRAAHHGTPLTVALLDLDGLKQINDTLGHAAGDNAITTASDIWQLHMRSGDLLARLGGDEFGLILPACDTDDAHDLLERLRSAADGPSVSCGLARLEPDDTPEELTDRADLALNEAKRRGRDQVVRSS